MNKNIENFVKEIRKYTKNRKKENPNRYKKKEKEADIIKVKK